MTLYMMSVSDTCFLSFVLSMLTFCQINWALLYPVPPNHLHFIRHVREQAYPWPAASRHVFQAPTHIQGYKTLTSCL